jgi:hypothetical protein
VSAIYGGYDTLKPVLPQNGAEVDWVLVTDDASIRNGALGWRVVHLPRPGTHPNRAAKVPKLFPWEFTDADRSVWVDASFRVTSPGFVTEALALADPIAQFVHPWRDCVYTEAEASVDRVKYTGEDFAAQVKAAREERHPENWGLWATGVIARRHDDDRVSVFENHWNYLIDKHTFQDQVSEPVALRAAGLRPASFPGTHFANDWVRYEGSANH